MVTNLKTVPRKGLNSITLKTRRRGLKSKKLHLKVFASFSRKSSEIKSKKCKSGKDLANHLVLLLLANTDGQLTWNAS
jgi:hypothetical protein